jgi:hypothetical protein
LGVLGPEADMHFTGVGLAETVAKSLDFHGYQVICLIQA